MIKINKPCDVFIDDKPLDKYYYEKIINSLDYTEIKNNYDKFIILKSISDIYNSDIEEFLNSLIKDDIFSDSYKYKDVIYDYISMCNIESVDVKIIGSLLSKYSKLDNSFSEGVISKECYFKNGNVRKINSREMISKYINDINGILKKVFQYSFISNELRAKILSTLNVDVCPYCNRSFISKYYIKDSIRTTADLDHIYPQKNYPMLALSIFNFIPACLLCNRNYKREQINLENPYHESFVMGGYYFRVKDLNDGNYEKQISGYADPTLEIVTDNKNMKSYTNELIPIDNKIDNEITSLHLEDIYQSHSSYVRDVLSKINNKYLDLLPKIGMVSESERMKFLFGFDFVEDELSHKPLAKLTFDIVLRRLKELNGI